MLVIKIGGGKTIGATSIVENAAKLVKNKGEKIVIVNGGNALLDQKMRDEGYEPRIITSERGEKSRFTDEQTIKFLKEVYVDEIADALVNILKRDCGVDAINLSKEDNPIIAKQHGRMRIVEDGKIKVIDGDLTGKIVKVEVEKIQKALDENKIPLLCPPAKTEDGKELNVDGDKIASQVAIALKADKLIFFSDTNGLLENVEDEMSTIPEISIKDADKFAVGRMKKKVLAAKRAIEAGVSEVIFADGRIENAIDAALKGESGTKVF